MTGEDETVADPLAKALFTAASLARDLRGATKEAAGAICFSELAHRLLRPDGRGADAVLDRAFGNPKLAPAAEALLRRIALAEFPAAAAASSGGLEMRERDSYRLRLATSLAADGPTYLLIEQAQPGAELPRLLVALQPGMRPEYAVLPEADTLPLQLMFDADAPFLRAFRNPDSRLFLT
ncbi:MAG: hypothetical protein JJ959_11165 [Nisaea sp.]|uniref:hypothetical protein n=1 Tax=Nisaea sp. TaxID=2024842 RepID=UPI001B03A6D5|nr:hypothetical protein [Nisaea sp.]MBO6561092.1 hypothetical protein [Nisaea sp.]